MNIFDKKIAILGLGIENIALLDFFIKHNAKDITICDRKSTISHHLSAIRSDNNITFQTGDNYLDGLEKFDIVFRTPGLPINNPKIQKAKKAGVMISSQMKLFFDLCPAKIIGVTGTKGKGTTSTLIYEILKQGLSEISEKDVRSSRGSQDSGKRLRPTFSKISNTSLQATNYSNVWLAGNIGNAPIELLDKIKKDDWVVLELSSFQLQDMEKSPNIAVVLNITSDHLDYHKDTNEYIDAKSNIVRYQKKDDATVINMDYNTSFEFAVLTKATNNYFFSTRKSVDLGTFIEWTQDKKSRWGKIILRTPKEDVEIVKTYDIQIRGAHNLENICAAITASYLAGSSIDSIKKIISKFKGLKYRIELVWENDGVKYYNDSASTNPDTTIAAIKAFNEPIILIAGGSDKGADYTRMGKEIADSSVKTLILMGVTADKIESSIRKNKIKIILVKDIKEAIERAKEEARIGDVVLFSPASASFDMFRDYKDRGAQFDKIVKS